MIQSIMVCKQTVFNFPQGIFSGNLRVKTRQKLPPCGEMLAITVAGQVFYGFLKTMSRYEIEKLLKDATVMHCRDSHAQIKDLRYL